MVARIFNGGECVAVVINNRLSAEKQRAVYYNGLEHYGVKDCDRTDTSITEMEMLGHYAI